jgi:glycosyltransferase involved in cell wall biosynthesis
VPVTIHTFHGHVFHSYFSPPVNFAIRVFEKTLAKFTSRIITISEQQKHEICQIYKIVSPDKCPVIPLGLDLGKFNFDRENRRNRFRSEYQLGEDEIALGIIGRFAPIKNHLLLFHAITLLKNQFPALYEKMILFCIGDGEMKTDFTTYLNNHNISYSDLQRTFKGGGVVFTSWVKNVDVILPGMDLVVLTSDNEGTPLSLIEAQAAGVAVLSTDVGGVRDVVLHEETGWLVPKSSPESICSTLVNLLNHPIQLNSAGKKGRKWVLNEFSYQRLIGDTEQLYHRLHKKRNKRNPLNAEKEVGYLPKVSIITVCKNRLTTLKDTVESVKLQNYPNIEYIVIDANSTDGTKEFLQKFSGIDKFISESDKGIYDAMNKGIRLSNGEIIAFLNSDDYYTTPDVISCVVKQFKESKADAVYGDIIYINESRKDIKRYWKAGRYRFNSFKWGWMPPHPAFFVKKEAINKYGNFIDSLTLSADYEMMLRLIHYHGILIEYLPKVLVSMRIGGASNQNISNRLMANKQDKMAWKYNRIKPNLVTTWLKPLRKLPQWLFPKWRVGKIDF